MPSQRIRKRLLGLGFVTVVVGALSGLSWVTSAAPQEHPVTSHLVSREHAEELIARFRATTAPGAVRAQSFDRSAFDALLAQPGAVGIRIYYGQYADGTDTVVLYATDKHGRDLMDMPANNSRTCPPFCPSDPGTETGVPRVNATTSQQKRPVDLHLISQERAEALIARYRATTAPGAVRAQSFDRSAFDALLAQPGAVGIRIYYGQYADGTDTVVLYATDKHGRDLMDMPANASRTCPPHCPDYEIPAGDIP